MQHQPEWYTQREREMGSTGRLSIAGEAVQDLSLIRTKTSMKVLDLSFTQITNFDGIDFQPNIETVIVTGTPMQNFRNISALSKMTKIYLQNTPVFKKKGCKLSLLITCKMNLRVINGKSIPHELRKKADSFPPIAEALVNAGWIAEYPCPQGEALARICAKFGVIEEFHEDEEEEHLEYIPERDIDTLIQAYTTVHENMVQEAAYRLSEPVPDEEGGLEFVDELSALAPRFPDGNILAGNGDDISSVYSAQSYESSIQISEVNDDPFDDPLVIQEDDGKGPLKDRLLEIFKKYGFEITSRNKNEGIINKIDELLMMTEDDDNQYSDYSEDVEPQESDDNEEEEGPKEAVVDFSTPDTPQPISRRPIPPLPKP